MNLRRLLKLLRLKMNYRATKKSTGFTRHHLLFVAILLFSVSSIFIQHTLGPHKRPVDNGKPGLTPFVSRSSNSSFPLVSAVELAPCHLEVGMESTRQGERGMPDEAAGEECVVSDNWRFVFMPTSSFTSDVVKSFLYANLCGDNRPCDMKATSCKQIWPEKRNFFFFSFVSSPFLFSYVSWNSSHTDGTSFVEWLQGLQRPGGRYLLQTSLILNKTSCASVDFVGRIEDMETHGPRLLQRIRSSASSLYSLTEVLMERDRNASRNASIAMIPGLIPARLATRKLDGRQQQLLAQLYSRDFELLGYEKEDAKYVDRVKETCFREEGRRCSLSVCAGGDTVATAYRGVLHPVTSRDRLQGPRFDFIPQVRTTGLNKTKAQRGGKEEEREGVD